MAALIEKNDCMHRSVCKYIGDGMCLTECGHMETQNTDNQQLKAEIAALITEFLRYGDHTMPQVAVFIHKLRQLSAV